MADDHKLSRTVERPSKVLTEWFPSRIRISKDDLIRLVRGDTTTLPIKATVFTHAGATERVDREGNPTGAYELDTPMNIGEVEGTLTAAQVGTILRALLPGVQARAEERIG